MEKVALMNSWAQNMGFLGIRELLDNWPYAGRVERHMHVTFACVQCGRESIEEYRRQDPDFLAWHKCCRWCANEVIAARFVLFNLWREWHSVTFGIENRCFQCGLTLSKRNNHPFLLLNGSTIHLCRNHRIAYQRHISRMAALADVKRIAIVALQREIAR